MQNYDPKKLSAVLKKARDIEVESRVKTFFDVAGFPRYENVLSNILAFFFDTNEEHGFKDLWLKSLLDCYNLEVDTHILTGEFEGIEREYSTEDKKRLDIIISLDNAVIAIENKIDAAPYNPFNSYHKEVLKYCENSKRIIEVLLSVKKEDDQKTSFGTVFYNITYKCLIGQIKKNIGDYIEDANEKWLLFMKEVLTNIENLGDRDSMNKEWQAFLKENGDSIVCFFDNYGKDIQSKIGFIKDLEHGLKDRLNDNSLSIGTYNTQNSESFKDYFSLYVDIQNGKDTIVIEPFISRKEPAFLVIGLWNRKNKKYDWAREIELVKPDFPTAKIVNTHDSWGWYIRLETLDFEKGVTLETVIERITGIVQVIKD